MDMLGIEQAEVKPFLLMYRVGGLIEGGHAAATAALVLAKCTYDFHLNTASTL